MNQDIFLDSLGDDVFEIRLERPERMNALGVATVAVLQQAVLDAATMRARVLLLRGSGRAFCAGADLKERKGMDLHARMEHNAAINDVINTIAGARFIYGAAQQTEVPAPASALVFVFGLAGLGWARRKIAGA